MPPQQQTQIPIDESLLYREDFVKSKDTAPHDKRRAEILKKHPEVKELYGVDPYAKYWMTLVALTQLTLAYITSQYTSSWVLYFLVAWWIGGTLNHSIGLALHETTHNLCFHKLEHSYIFSILLNLPIGAPVAMTFRRYHHEHHIYQGVPGWDTDVPAAIEGHIIRSKFLRLLNVIFMSLFYALQPVFINPKIPDLWEILGWTTQISFDVFIIAVFGWKTMFFLFISTFMGLGLHPLSGHFISEHYLFKENQETTSYYGIANWITWNVGYHNEHHDFPKIPASRLPLLKKIAPEYYDNLASYKSWTQVVIDYIMTDGYTPFNRMTRSIDDHRKARKRMKTQ